MSNYLLREAPLKHSQQPKYGKNDYHHDYNPKYARHRFASFHMWLGLSFFPLKAQRKITRDRSSEGARLSLTLGLLRLFVSQASHYTTRY